MWGANESPVSMHFMVGVREGEQPSSGRSGKMEWGLESGVTQRQGWKDR